mgnify:CR=1 FL=1
MSEEHLRKESEQYLKVFLIGLFILAAEIAGGPYSNSLALIGDAAHVFTDNVAIAVSLAVVVLIKRGRNESRVRTIGFWINIILMPVVIAWIVYEAVERIGSPHHIRGEMMFAVALIGGLLNAWQLQTLSKVEKNKTHKALSLHVVGDLLVSAGVVAASVLILIFEENLIDPATSLAIALWLLYQTGKTIRGCGHSHDHHH